MKDFKWSSRDEERKIPDPITLKGRTIDHAVIKNEKVIYLIEKKHCRKSGENKWCRTGERGHGNHQDKMINYVICDVASSFSASINRTFRQRALDVFYHLAKFLQDNHLLNKVILKESCLPDEKSIIRKEDLTDEGYQVVHLDLDKWFDGHDRGKAIDDVRILAKALTKVRADKSDK